jgi:hypothetical protein
MPACGLKLGLLLKRGNVGAGQEYAKTLLAKAIEQDNVILLEFTHGLLHDKTESKDLLALALRAAEAIVRIDGGANAWSLVRLADAHLVNGDTAKAKEYARKAIDAAAGESAEVHEQIEKDARKLGVNPR